MILALVEYGYILMFIIKLLSLNNNDKYNKGSTNTNNNPKTITNYIGKSTTFITLLGINILINILLKNIIKQERPQKTDKYGELQRYGMPSGHSQMVWFMLFFDIQQTNKYISFILLILAGLTSYQRYKCNYHTILQILVGGLLGGFIGFYSTSNI